MTNRERAEKIYLEHKGDISRGGELVMAIADQFGEVERIIKERAVAIADAAKVIDPDNRPLPYLLGYGQAKFDIVRDISRMKSE